VSWLVVLQYIAVTAAGCALAVCALTRRRLTAAQQTRVFIGTTVAYALVVGDLFEYGDNNRFRFETDPLVCVAFVALVVTAITARSRRGRAAPTDRDDSPPPEESLRLDTGKTETSTEPLSVGARSLERHGHSPGSA
jgi:hypothetical protein